MDVDGVRHTDTSWPGHAALYADAKERTKHMAYITAIAQEKHKAIPEVADCYERILIDMRHQARVHDYLNVFVAKRVIELLKGSQ